MRCGVFAALIRENEWTGNYKIKANKRKIGDKHRLWHKLGLVITEAYANTSVFALRLLTADILYLQSLPIFTLKNNKDSVFSTGIYSRLYGKASDKEFCQ